MQVHEKIVTQFTGEEARPQWSLPSGRTEPTPLTWSAFVACRRRARMQRRAFSALLSALV